MTANTVLGERLSRGAVQTFALGVRHFPPPAAYKIHIRVAKGEHRLLIVLAAWVLLDIIFPHLYWSGFTGSGIRVKLTKTAW